MYSRFWGKNFTKICMLSDDLLVMLSGTQKIVIK
jgi:hypothetical protein